MICFFDSEGRFTRRITSMPIGEHAVSQLLDDAGWIDERISGPVDMVSDYVAAGVVTPRPLLPSLPATHAGLLVSNGWPEGAEIILISPSGDQVSGIIGTDGLVEIEPLEVGPHQIEVPELWPYLPAQYEVEFSL